MMDARQLRLQLVHLNEELDQLAAEAIDDREQMPYVATALAIAWWFTEAALRHDGGAGTCGHVTVQPSCQCCRQFAELRNQAERIRRSL